MAAHWPRRALTGFSSPERAIHLLRWELKGFGSPGQVTVLFTSESLYDLDFSIRIYNKFSRKAAKNQIPNVLQLNKS